MAWDSSFQPRKTCRLSVVRSVALNLRSEHQTNGRCYVPSLVNRWLKTPKQILLKPAKQDLTPLLGIKAAPLFTTVCKHTQAMAQYQVGHQEIVNDIQRLTNRLHGLALAGNGYHGIGIPDCIRSGETAAISLLDTRIPSRPQAR